MLDEMNKTRAERAEQHEKTFEQRKEFMAMFANMVETLKPLPK